MHYEEYLTFDDVLLLPQHSKVLPHQVNLSTHLTKKIKLHIPFISAAMDRVTESSTSLSMSRMGGLGVIHRNLSIEKQTLEVEKVKKSESGMILDPITLQPNDTVRQAKEYMKKYSVSGLPIVEEKKLLGMVTNRDLRFEEDLDKDIMKVMKPLDELILGHEGISMQEAIKLMHVHRIEKLPIINKSGILCGLITIKDIQKNINYPLAIRDSQGSLQVGAAIGTGDMGKKRVEALIKSKVDVLVIDTAHGDSDNVIDILRWIKKNYSIEVIAGNVATESGAQRLIDNGADAIKVGMGSGSICTTRIISGIGVPQMSAILKCRAVTKKSNIPLIADGGIKYSGDCVKALAAGADVIMIGSLFAGCDESPGEVVFYQGRTYKSYRGMGSIEAMKEGSSDRYQQALNQEDDLIPEGIEGMVPYRGSLMKILHQLTGGVRAGLGYIGAQDIRELQEKAQFIKISPQGLKESHVHDVFVTKEAPNYRPHFD